MPRFDPENPQPYFTGSGVGKLFPDPKPTEEHRWPRGYTPGRQEEMRDALSKTTFQGTPTEEEKTTVEQRAGESSESGPVLGRARRGARARFQNRFTDVMARSSAPPSDVEGLSSVWESEYLTSPERHGGSGVAGAYWYDQPANQHASRSDDPSTWPEKRSPWIAVQPGAADSTLVHEVGHHASSKDSGYGERQRVRSKENITPREEAYADDYMLRHHKPGGQTYGSRGSFHEDPEAQAVYEGARQEPERPPKSHLNENQFGPSTHEELYPDWFGPEGELGTGEQPWLRKQPTLWTVGAAPGSGLSPTGRIDLYDRESGQPVSSWEYSKKERRGIMGNPMGYK